VRLSWADYEEQDSRTNLSEEGGNDTILGCIMRLHGMIAARSSNRIWTPIHRLRQLENPWSDQSDSNVTGPFEMSYYTGPNIRPFGLVDRRQIHGDIFVDSCPTSNRTPGRVWSFCPIPFGKVRPGPGSKTSSPSFKMLDFCVESPKCL